MTGPSPLDRLTESYFDIRWNLDPVEGSGAGRSSGDARLGSFSDDSIRRHTAALRSLMTAVEEVEVSSLDDEIDRTALLYDIRVAEHRYRREQPHRRDPGLWAGHVLEGLYQLLVARDRDAAALATAAAARLRAIPAFLDEACATLENCPRVLVDAALASVRPGNGLVDEVERTFPPPSPEPEPGAAAGGARDALARFSAHLSGLLQSSGPDEPWGIGKDALQFRLAHQHAVAASTEELLRYGAALIEEVERELTALAGSLGGGAWPDVLARLREEHVDETDLAAAYTAMMERARSHVGVHGLAAVPDGDLEVTLTPAYAIPWTPVAAYLPPGPLARDRTGRFFVTPPEDGGVGDHPRGSLASTAVHEGFPGHHVHLLTAHESPRLARRLLFAPITVEGWALYCESLMEETGFYATPEERFFRLVALLWRALRVPVDVGVHTGALTHDAAVGIVRGRLHVPRARAEAEVRRAYAQPAGLLAYAVGRRELLDLRARFQRRAGSAASLRDFHDALFRYGALPTSLARWGLGLRG